MALLDAPTEILELGDGESTTFTILRYQRGEIFIIPRGLPAGKEIPIIRLHVSSADKPIGAPYWDVTAGNLIARLLPMLDQLVAGKRPIKVTKHGQAPFARHQVDFL